MDTIPEFTNQAPDPIVIESSRSSLIKLETDISEGESLDSVVLRAMEEAKRIREQARAATHHQNRSSQELAQSMLRNKTREDSEAILA